MRCDVMMCVVMLESDLDEFWCVLEFLCRYELWGSECVFVKELNERMGGGGGDDDDEVDEVDDDDECG